MLDISDHYSLFCFIHCLIPIKLTTIDTTKYKIRDYSNFFEDCFFEENMGGDNELLNRQRNRKRDQHVNALITLK